MDNDPMLSEAFDDQLLTFTFALLDSSDEDEDDLQHGGSREGRSANINRDRLLFAEQLHKDYFCDTPTYSDTSFTRRFRVTRQIFNRIVNALIAHDDFFKQKRDCTNLEGLSPRQKCTAAIRMLAYGSGADAVDEYVRLGESTALKTMKRFCAGVVVCFGSTYLRTPTEEDVRHLLATGEAMRFPGMLGSIDCCKWRWKNCPTAFHGKYTGKEGVSAITMEAIADDRLWIWHMFFGMPGCNNDINVFEASPLVASMSAGIFPPPLEYEIGGEMRNKPYLLSDNIYPKSPLFLQSVLNPATAVEKYYATRQEGRRKDIERAFGVLQAKFHIVARPCRLWYISDMQNVMQCCVILHNMMVDDRESLEEGRGAYQSLATVGGASQYCFFRSDEFEHIAPPGTIAAMCAVNKYLQNANEYMKTRSLVMNHISKEMA